MAVNSCKQAFTTVYRTILKTIPQLSKQVPPQYRITASKITLV